jgi:hypothetical protein
MGQLADLLDQQPPPERDVRQPDVPKGWEPGVRWSNETGTGELITPPLEAAPDASLWVRILNDFGLSGDEFEIIDGSLSLIGWKSPVKGALPDDPPERQTINLTRYKVRLRRKTHARDTVDIDALCKAARQRKPSKRDTKVTDRALVVCLADWQVGKALQDDTPMLTTEGWTTHGELRPGMSVFSPSGKPVQITGVTGSTVQRVYRLAWDDGSETLASGDHIWEGWRRYNVGDGSYERRRVTYTTSELSALGVSDSRGRSYVSRPFHVDLCEPIHQPEALLPIDPYLLGAWLGDGSRANGYIVSSYDDVEHWQAQWPDMRLVHPDNHVAVMATAGLASALRKAGLKGNKHIPDEYLYASAEQRLALVQGLMDTDGHCTRNGSCEFTQVNTAIADGMAWLLRSLGLKVKRTVKATTHQDAHVLRFTPDADLWYQVVFRMERKADRLRRGVGQWSFSYLRSVECVGEASAQCITVDGSLYLAGNELRTTHNSEGGGSAATVDRITEAFDALERRLFELAKVGRPVGLVYLVGLGDIVEQCSGHYPSQPFTTDLNRREQMRVARRLILNVVDRMVDRGLTVVLSAVAGNHGENREQGKAITTPDDSDDLAVFEQVGEILASNPDRYSNVSVFLPPALSMTLDIAGVPVGFTHGHIARGGTGPVGKIEKWWTGQVMGFGPVADARILVTGHYHHLLVVESTGRTHLQCPAMDGGSGWWTESTGQHSPAGMLTFLAGTDCGPRGWDELRVL